MGSQIWKHSGNSIFRAVFVAFSFLLQLGWILVQILALNNSPYIAAITNLIAILAVLKLYSKHTNAAYKLPWIMLIMAMPVMGLSMYLLTQYAYSSRKIRKRLNKIREESEKFLSGAAVPTGDMPKEEKNLSQYLMRHGKIPLWSDTEAKYYGETLDALEDMKRDLEQAEHFIFMEYFILEEGEAFRQLREILERKARQGVEVRLMYDDLGSIGTTSWRYAKELNDLGIQCRPFNPALPFLNLFLSL